MKRVILTIPEGLSFDQLTPDQQAAIQGVFAQYVLPMPGTQAHNAKVIIDAITGDNFDPATIAPLGLPFEVLAIYQWDGVGELVTIQALDDVIFTNYLSPVNTYDENGNIISSTPATLHEPHRFGGWPAII